MKAIKSYNWPGNIRELMNCIESSIVMTGNNEVNVDNLPPFLSHKSVKHTVGKEPENLSELEKKAVIDALNKTGGNKTEAAKNLGIGLRTLYRKLELYGLKN
jgi:transcriptional regulator of acetoin/glycerol metabolism